jgi:hypothetical protein
MSDFELVRASSITAKFIEEFLNAGPLQEEATGEDAESMIKGHSVENSVKRRFGVPSE